MSGSRLFDSICYDPMRLSTLNLGLGLRIDGPGSFDAFFGVFDKFVLVEFDSPHVNCVITVSRHYVTSI